MKTAEREMRDLLNEAPQFFSHHEFDGEKLKWIQRMNAALAKPPTPEQQAGEAALMANRADEEMRRAEHYKKRALLAEKQLAEQQAPQGVVFVCPEKDVACEEVFRKCSNCPAAPEAAKPETERAISISQLACKIDGETRYAYQEILRLVQSINYMVGIAERGRGVKCPAEMSPEKFLLDYVKELEAAALLAADSKAGGEPVAKDKELAQAIRDVIVDIISTHPEHYGVLEAVARALTERPQQQAKPRMTPGQVRDGIADWIETNIQHREFWTPAIVDLIRSIEINEDAAFDSKDQA